MTTLTDRRPFHPVDGCPVAMAECNGEWMPHQPADPQAISMMDIGSMELMGLRLAFWTCRCEVLVVGIGRMGHADLATSTDWCWLQRESNPPGQDGGNASIDALP